MIQVKCDYTIAKDIGFFMEAEKINNVDLAENVKISRTTLNALLNGKNISEDVCEKIYSYIYENNYRLNSVKEEFAKENYHDVLFHGSKNGLTTVSKTGSRDRCDFGNSFYLGQTYSQALSFVYDRDKSSVYSFKYSLDNLKVKQFQCDLEWMLTICYYRGTLKKYEDNELIKRLAKEVEETDVVIAPIADNKMFYIMAQFTDGEINADVALHSLSASNLGLQYIFKTDKAIDNLEPIERYYLSIPEKEDCKKKSEERGFEIDTKLKLAKREYKTGLYIEEILK